MYVVGIGVDRDSAFTLAGSLDKGQQVMMRFVTPFTQRWRGTICG